MTDTTCSQTEDLRSPDPAGVSAPGAAGTTGTSGGQPRRPRRGRRARALSGVAGAGIALGLVTFLPGTGDPQTTVCPGPGATCSIVASTPDGSGTTAS